MGRCALDIYRKNTNIVYAEFEHATLGGVYRSEDKGATWTRMSDTNPRPSYFSQIRVDPNNDQKIWLGGVNIYMSEDGGRTFVQTRFRDVHSDVHAIWIDPANSDHMLSGNDGGVWVTWDSGRNWRAHQQHRLGQFYEVAYDFQKPYHVCGGLQDNYSWCGPSSSTAAHRHRQRGLDHGAGRRRILQPHRPQRPQHHLRRIAGRQPLAPRPADQRIEIHPPAGRQRHRAALPLPVEFAPHDFAARSQDASTTAAITCSNPPTAATPGSVLGEDLTTGADRDKQTILGKVPERGKTLSLHDGVVAWPCITAIAESPVKRGRALGGHRRRQRADVARRRQDVAQRGQPHARACPRAAT